MKKITYATLGLKLLAQKNFYGKGIKVAYKVLPYKDPTFNPNDKAISVAFKVGDKIYVGEPEKGEIMHFLLLANLPEDIQHIFYEQTEENESHCAGFFTADGCFYTREQNRDFFGFDQSYNGLDGTKKDSKPKPYMEILEDSIQSQPVKHNYT